MEPDFQRTDLLLSSYTLLFCALSNSIPNLSHDSGKVLRHLGSLPLLTVFFIQQILCYDPE